LSHAGIKSSLATEATRLPLKGADVFSILFAYIHINYVPKLDDER